MINLDYNQRDYCYIPQVLSLEDINFLKNFISENPNFTKNDGSFIPEDVNPNVYRKVWEVPLNSKFKSIYKKIYKSSKKANESFGFDLEFLPYINFVKYTSYGKTGLDWHMDIGPKPYNQRKLSFSVMLSNENNYEGGDLELMIDSKIIEKCPKQIGSIIFFPSFIMHRITPVIQGERDVLVGFFSGKPYK